jgi:hypothetical protein
MRTAQNFITVEWNSSPLPSELKSPCAATCIAVCFTVFPHSHFLTDLNLVGTPEAPNNTRSPIGTPDKVKS